MEVEKLKSPSVTGMQHGGVAVVQRIGSNRCRFDFEMKGGLFNQLLDGTQLILKINLHEQNCPCRPDLFLQCSAIFGKVCSKKRRREQSMIFEIYGAG